MLNYIKTSIDFDRMFKQHSMLALATVIAIGSLSSTATPVNADGVGTGYINGAEQFPQTRATQVRHTIRFMIPTAEIDRIKIFLPQGIKVGSNITLSIPILVQQNSIAINLT